MGKTRLSDFIIEGTYGELDIAKLMKISDNDFIEIYRREVEEYIRNHGDMPTCLRCTLSISHPSRLIRYFGANLHPDCFLGIYQGERENLSEEERNYFDRVSKLFAPQMKLNVPVNVH